VNLRDWFPRLSITGQVEDEIREFKQKCASGGHPLPSIKTDFMVCACGEREEVYVEPDDTVLVPPEPEPLRVQTFGEAAHADEARRLLREIMEVWDGDDEFHDPRSREGRAYAWLQREREMRG
jgi:hypothetical protein